MRKGFFWHVHHDVLMEWCYDYNHRAQYICIGKPAHERELRLHLFQPVISTLPDAVVKAWQAYDNSQDVTGDPDETWKGRDEAWKAFDKALHEHQSEIESLHKAECSNCPWNGQTIFPAV